MNPNERIIFDAPLGATSSWKSAVKRAKPSGGLAKGEVEVFLICFLQVWRGADRLTVMAVATSKMYSAYGDLSSSYSSSLGSYWQIYSMMNP